MGRNMSHVTIKANEPCYDPKCMDTVAPLINGCMAAVHAGSLAGVDTSGFAVGDLLWNTDGMNQIEQWDGYCPKPLANGFVGMIITLPDGTQVKSTSRNIDSGKLVWEAVPPASNIDPAAVAAALTGDPDALAALVEAITPALISADAGNTIRQGADGKLFENDAVTP